VNNFGEFALGTSPTTADAALPVARLVSIAGVNYPALDIRRSLAAADSADLVVESSANLSTWTRDLLPVSETNHGDGTATVTWRSVRSFSETEREYLRARFVLR
jgi:hypothetical protein